MNSLSNHEHFEEICGLIAAGDIRDIPQADLNDWNEHCQHCAQCREISELHIVGLVLSSVSQTGSSCDVPAGMTERFIVRAEREGIRFSAQKQERSNRALFWWAIAATAAFLVALAINLLQRGQVQPTRDRQIVSSPQSSPTSTLRTSQEDSLRDQLHASQNKAQELARNLEIRKQALEAAQAKEENLKSRIVELERENEFREKGRLTQLQQEIERLRAQREADHNASVVEEAELASVKAKISRLTGELDAARRLNAATKLALDLVVARNLHVITVHDANENGEQEKAFGRIFYAEGRNLVFYAYDLPQPGTPETNISFYVWGEKSGTKKPARNLGIFSSDDPDDSRWVLKFDDPKVLTQINSVFVTAEPDKSRATQPTGKRILSTRLDVRPNQR